MAAATTITEAEVGAYAHARLGRLANLLGWTVDAGSYDEVVQRVLALYGVETLDDLDSAEAVQFVKACTRFAVWEQAAEATAGLYNFSQAGASLTRSQVCDQTRKAKVGAWKDLRAMAKRLRMGSDLLTSADIAVYPVYRSADEYDELEE